MTTLDNLMVDHYAERIARYKKEKEAEDKWWDSLTVEQRIEFQRDLDAKNKAHNEFWENNKYNEDESND